MKTKHTEGPWRFCETWGLILAKDKIEIAACHAGRGWDAKANAARIIECVNACEGIADPSIIPELVDALYTALACVEECDTVNKPTKKMAPHYRKLLSRIENR